MMTDLALLQQLIGKPLWTCRRVADMATFHFGARHETRTHQGRTATIGEFALHVQCTWRIIKLDAVVVGSRDLCWPATADAGGDFDWNRSVSRRDVMLDTLFEKETRKFDVLSISVNAGGNFTLHLSEDYALEVFVDDSLSHEHWRLFSTEYDANALIR